jgi:hypothetical protein
MTQDEALSILKAGASVFLTGEPGSGKTHTLNTFVRFLRAYGVEPAITASTGIAATHIGGMTIHSWSGIGIKKHLTQKDVEILKRTPRLAQRIKKTKVLIIDEISMLDGQTLDAVNQVCQKIRGSEEPFGGLQMVVVGDFFQLPPIAPRGESAVFAFQAASWRSVNWAVCYLTEQHRQTDGEAEFIEVLGAMRGNRVESRHVEVLDRRMLRVRGLPEDIPQLFTHNRSVDEVNDDALRKLEGEEEVFEMAIIGREKFTESLRKGCLSPEILKLKRDAVVMFTKNHPQGKFVNGTLGRVEGFESESGYPIVRTRDGRRIEVTPAEWVIEEDEEVVASIEQVPLRLAWAMTVHKSQGMSLDAALIDLRGSFEYGQGYVALSRVRSLSGLHLLGYNRRAFEVHPEIVAIDEYFRERSEAMARAVQALSLDDLQTKWQKFLQHCGANAAKIRRGTEKKLQTTSSDTVYSSSSAQGESAAAEGEVGDDASVKKMKKSRPSLSEEPQKEKPEGEYAATLEKMRETYPNAYRPWKEADDVLLKQLFAAEMSVKEISRELGRQPGSIRTRLEKWELIQD